MSKIIPQLWLDREAIEAADFYLSIFPDSRKLRRTKLEDAPCGEHDSRSIDLMGQEFMLVCAGSDYSINSSVSFLIECTSQEETYAIFSKLLENEDELEAIEDYDFNQINRLEDRYGISWMIQYQPTLPTQRITPVLLFVGSAFGKAEEAVKFYVLSLRTLRLMNTGSSTTNSTNKTECSTPRSISPWKDRRSVRLKNSRWKNIPSPKGFRS